MNITKRLYIFISIVGILFFSLKLIVINFFYNGVVYFDFVFFLLLFLIFYFLYGKIRSKNYLKTISIKYIIILLLSYTLIVYLLGLFMGFNRTIYSFDFFSIIDNVLPIIFIIFFKEYIRLVVSNKSFQKIGPYILLTIFYILINIFNSYLASSLNTSFAIFNFMCLTILPAIAKECVSSYITYKIGFLPTFIYNLVFDVPVFILPIFPNLGNYLTSILGIFFPFLLFIIIKKLLNYQNKEIVKLKTKFIKLICFPIVLFALILVVLISGVFSYKLIAIGSDSMNPIYYRGDAVIYEKTSFNNIKKGDILVFSNNGSVITHRVVKIVLKGIVFFFKLKVIII